VPIRIRAALAAIIATLIFPLVGSQVPAEASLGMIATAGVGELMIGVTVGLGVSLLLMGAELAGLIVGQQAALGLAQVFNPNLNTESSIMGQLYSIAFMFVFLIAGGHRAALEAVLDTYQVIPLLTFQLDEQALLLLIEILMASFMLAIRVAGPVLIALFLTETSMGFLSRTIPQLNILTVGFSLRVVTALAVAGVAIVASQGLMVDSVWDGLDLIRASFGLEPTRRVVVI
jgi:flagellar biosynthetic protein FliR